MKQKRFSDEQIIGSLKEADAGAVVLDLCRKHGMSSATFYAWKSKYGGLEVSEAKRLRGLQVGVWAASPEKCNRCDDGNVSGTSPIPRGLV